MGARNVTAAFTHWNTLPHAPFRVLLFMALVSRDGEQEPRYWGGVEAIAEALGRRPGPSGVLAHRDQVAVSSALAALCRAGAARLLVRPCPGRRAEYALVLDPTHTPVDKPRNDQAQPDHSATNTDPTIRLSLTHDQAHPDFNQAEPDFNQAQPGPKEERKTREQRGRTTPQSQQSPGRVIALGKTDHGCIRGWLPDDTGQRGAERCPTCHPTAPRALA